MEAWLVFLVMTGMLIPHEELERPPIGVVSFELHRGHLVVVRGTAGPVRDLVLLLDTGASRTIVPAEFAATMERATLATSVDTHGPTVASAEIAVPALTFGPLAVREHPALVVDLEPTSRALGLDRLDGIVGMDVLGRTSFRIDYRRREVVFGAGRRTRHRVRLHPDQVFAVVRVEVGRERLAMVVGTGASHLVRFRLGSEPQESAGVGASAVGLGGPMKVSGIIVPDVRIGSWRASQVPLCFARAPISLRAEGLLAPTALRAAYVHFDFARREFSWQP